MGNAGNTVTEGMNNTSREMSDSMNNNLYSATRTSPMVQPLLWVWELLLGLG